MTTTSNQWVGMSLAQGRYRITAKLGEGGMGFVYRAVDQNIDSEVVIKVPRQAMMDDPEFAGRFTREIRSLVKLSHPHIVKVTDVGTFEDIPFAVMQFLAGGSLEDQRSAGPGGQALPCDPRGISRWLIAVADALDYIHGEGYVHRDVKPGNILFDSLGHAFLSDFGVAKVIASTANAAPAQTAMTGAGMVLGTPEYMAPELIMGEEFDGRVDQYALAITVYEMLCGRRPFENETKTKVLVLHTSKSPPALTDFSPGLPQQLSQAVLKGLSKNPADRYPRCADLAKAVSALAESAAPRSDRVRLKCSACGKTCSISAGDFARLKSSGKRAPCPACKAPIDHSSAESVAPVAVPAPPCSFRSQRISQSMDWPATLRHPSPGPRTGAPWRFRPRPRKQTPPARASGTIIERTLPRASGTIIERTLPRASGTIIERTLPQASGTIIERALPCAGEPAGIDVFKNISGAPPGLKQKEPAGQTAKPAADKTRLVIAGAAAAAAALVTTVGTTMFLSSSKKPDNSPTVAQTAKTQQPAANQPETLQSALRPSQAVAALSKPIGQPTAPDLSAASSLKRLAPPSEQPAPPAPIESAENSPSEEADAAPATKKTPTKKKANPTAKRAQPRTPSGFFATNQFDASRLPKRLTTLEYSRGKNLERAKTHRGETLIAGGMFAVSHTNADHPSGARKYVVTEMSLDEHGSQKVLQLTAHGSAELEVEPRLARSLDSLDRKFLKNSVAILTLLVDSAGELGLVGAEFLERCTPRLKKGYGIGQADVEYQALSISPEASKSDKSPDEEWQRVGRMGPFFTHWKHRVDAMNKMRQTMSMAQMQNVMGSLYSDAMKGVAAAGAAERARQGAISGR